MRVFYRSAPALIALSVALAGCSQADDPSPNASAGSVSSPSSVDAGATASVKTTGDSDVCLTVDGMT